MQPLSPKAVQQPLSPTVVHMHVNRGPADMPLQAIVSEHIRHSMALYDLQVELWRRFISFDLLR
jgi:hypothetical protein